ncbi:MAG TPA: ABC transporter permease [Marmoricola sp.]
MPASTVGGRVLIAAFVRRDRWMVVWFTIGVTILFWAQAYSVDGLYRTRAEFDRAAASMDHNTAFIAMAGPARALNTTGGQVTWQASAFGAIAVALMVMFMIGRHTRAEEESGRDELVRSGVVGRLAPMVAAYVVACGASLVVGLGVTISLVAYGLGAAGAIALGLGLFLCGTAFGAIALVAAQLTSSTRAAYGITGAVIGATYALRAIGDVGNGALSWLSPIGWYQAMHAYSGERWWPAALLAVLSIVGVVLAVALFRHRDVGAGLWPDRPGPSRAGAGLASSFGLAWQLQRGSLFGWAAGLFLGGVAYGTIGDDVKSLIGDSSFAKDVFSTGGPDIVDSFYAASALMLALVACGFAIASALRPRAEESAGHVEPLLSTGLGRGRWLGGHLLIAGAGTVLALTLSGLGLGVGFALVTGDSGRVGPFTWAALSLAPAVLLLAAIAVLLYGALPQWASLAWLPLVFCVVVMMFGAALRFPSWIMGVSPFRHLSSVPADPENWAHFATVLALAVVVGVAGVFTFDRRDVH